MARRFLLQRFGDAQSHVFEEVCLELQEGRKKGHWTWFIFPQIEGLGYSPLARKYAISSREEAESPNPWAKTALYSSNHPRRGTFDWP